MSATFSRASAEQVPRTPANSQYRPLPEPAQETPPLVLVEGFLSYTSEFWWGDFETHLNGHRAKIGSKKRRHIIFARVSPVNSVHDRACELFYSLRGGIVDYGEEHSKQNGHGRYGRHHSVGLYPSWSVEHPLHLLGHSMGGVTIVKMITMIRDGFFGPGAHPDMIASINSVGSPFRGTQLAYSITGGHSIAPRFRPLAPSAFLSKFIHLVTYFSPVLPSAFVPDLHHEARKLTMWEITPFELVRQLWRSDWSEGKDATPWDCTFEAGEARDEEFLRFCSSGTGSGMESNKTWYRSYVTTWTGRTDPEEPYHAPNLSKILVSAPFFITAFIMGGFDFHSLKPVPQFLSSRQSSPEGDSTSDEGGDDGDEEAPPEASSSSSSLAPRLNPISNPGSSDRAQAHLGEHYWANDGVVPLISQWHPGDCDESSCLHHPILKDTARLPTSHLHAKSIPRPGLWNVIHVDDTHHLSLMPLWMGSKKQRTFWYGLGEWLEEVDAARMFLSVMDGSRDVRMDAGRSSGVDVCSFMSTSSPHG